MTAIAGGAEVFVISHLIVMRICLCLSMSMAVYAFKGGEISLIDMAVGTGVPAAVMGTGIDREIGGVMIPRSVGPVRGVVAGLAGCREISGRMIGIIGPIIIALVAGIAIGWSAGKTGCMAGNACNCGMFAGKRETRSIVIKCRRRPAVGCMATGAGMAEIPLDMIGISGLLEVALMAGIAIG